MGLAEPIGEAPFRLAPELAATLTRMGERGDIIRTMQRAFSAARIERAAADQAIYDPFVPDAAPPVSRVLARSHYVALGAEAAADVGEGAVVRVDPARPQVRAADRTVAAVAAANEGRYDIDAHLRHDPVRDQLSVDVTTTKQQAKAMAEKLASAAR